MRRRCAHCTPQSARGSEYQALSATLATEDATKRLDEQLATIRARVQQLESALR